MTMNWYDYRLSYYNLKTSMSSNVLAQEEIENIWIPLIVFLNTDNNEATM